MIWFHWRCTHLCCLVLRINDWDSQISEIIHRYAMLSTPWHTVVLSTSHGTPWYSEMILLYVCLKIDDDLQ